MSSNGVEVNILCIIMMKNGETVNFYMFLFPYNYHCQYVVENKHILQIRSSLSQRESLLETRKYSCGKSQEAYHAWHNVSKHKLSGGYPIPGRGLPHPS